MQFVKVKNQSLSNSNKASGLLSSLGIKIPLSTIPLAGPQVYNEWNSK